MKYLILGAGLAELSVAAKLKQDGEKSFFDFRRRNKQAIYVALK